MGRTSGSGAGRSSGGPSGRSGGSGTGRSPGRTSAGARAGGMSHASSHAGASSSRAPGRPPGSRRGSSHYQQQNHGARRGRRRKPAPDYRVIAVVGVVLILAIAAVVYGMQHNRKTNADPQSTEAATTEPETQLEKKVTVDGIEITGMSRDEARAEILKKYPWNMKITYKEDTYDVSNLMEEKVNLLLDEIYRGEPKEVYTLDTSGLEEAAQVQAAAAAARWNQNPKNGSISRYEPSNDTFVFEGEAAGISVDQEKLAADIEAALKAKKFDAVIAAPVSEVQPEISVASAKEKYKTIGTYTTKTTSNKKRNTNIRLACEALNGTIVQPGQEVSFNDTVGERTAAKGYQGAAAYNNGEVVEEIGGGVCQVSTTLYNAVLRAGLKISVRRSHTFEPSYVTPGQDATVSWGGPDFKFINNSSTSVGIRAKYADQTVTISVYGIPILEEGVTYSLESTKIADLDPPAPTYEEDQTLQPDQEVQKSAGTRGSRWETRLVVKKGEEVISREVDHTTTYKGHAPVVKRNTSGVVIPAEGSTESGAETSPGETQPGESQTAPLGPGVQGPGQTTAETPAPTVPAPGNEGIEGGPGVIDVPTPPIQEPSPGGPVDMPGQMLSPEGPQP
ncbi:MAG: vanomycin resistance protein VanB [Hungatella sp.]|nr:vanomycin resistance protein VanB [Hungatella sp.]